MTMQGVEPAGELSAEIGIQIAAGLGSLAAIQRRSIWAAEARARGAIPRFARVPFTFGNAPAVYTTGQNLVLSADGPQQGEIWEIRQITIGGVHVTDTPAGTGYVFAGTTPPADVSLGVCRAATTLPLPQFGTWGSGLFRVRAPTNLYVVIVGGTNGASYSASADVDVFQETLLTATTFVE